MSPRTVALLIVFGSLAGAACRDRDPSRPLADASFVEEIEAGPIAPPPVNALDFTVSGCPKFDARLPQCQGPAPLTITFVPVASSSFLRFQWAFGDGTSVAADATPTHTYEKPGLYDVTLRGVGAAGSVADVVSRSHLAFIQVTANPLGEPCDRDDQCDEPRGLRCLCAGGRCGPAFTRGICSSPCAPPCPAASACLDLGLGVSGAAPSEEWQQQICLPSCSADADCSVSQICRALPDAQRPGAWTKACFVARPAAVGAACRGATGQREDNACVSGRCEDLGARGLCSLDCSQVGCPDGSACALLSDGRARCLRACGLGEPCDADPLLACEAPRDGGPLGFSVREHVAGTTYCAPRRCNSDVDCGPAGRCQAEAQGAHCVRRGA